MLVSVNIRASNFSPVHYNRARLSDTRDVAERSQAKIGRTGSGQGGGGTKPRFFLCTSLSTLGPETGKALTRP